jgi:hypothetical protein
MNLTEEVTYDPTTGYISANALTSNTYYDHRGDTIEQTSPTGLVSKMTYEGPNGDALHLIDNRGSVNRNDVRPF